MRISLCFVTLSILLLASCSTKSEFEAGEQSQTPEQEEAVVGVEDGEWRLVSYREGLETHVYNKNNEYMLSFSDEDDSFDLIFSNDTIDGAYTIVNDTIRFKPDEEAGDIKDKVLLMVYNTNCVGSQNNDTIILTLSDDCEAVFTRID